MEILDKTTFQEYWGTIKKEEMEFLVSYLRLVLHVQMDTDKIKISTKGRLRPHATNESIGFDLKWFKFCLLGKNVNILSIWKALDLM